MVTEMKILFVCEFNACRSQMAEGLARTLLPKAVLVQSAGLYPGEVHSWTIEVMREIGIDISSHSSKKLEVVSSEIYDYVIILAKPAMEASQLIQAKNYLSWFHPDPAKNPGSEEQVKMKIRWVRDTIKSQIEAFMTTL